MSVAAQVLDLAAGRDHSLVLRSGAQLVGWGGDGTGRFPAPLGVCSAPSSESGAVYVPTDVELRHITASAGMSLALDAQGVAYVWGANRAGLGGRLSHIVAQQPKPLAGLPALAQLRGSEFFTLARARDGGLYHWGLAPGSAQARNAGPLRVAGVPAIADCCAGVAHALLLDGAQRVWGWGANTAGQLGAGHLQDYSEPTRVPIPRKMVAVAAGASHSLAIDVRGQVWAWGSNQHGQLGERAPAYRTAPHQVALPEGATQVAAGQYVSYALGRSGRLYAWGWNARGQLGQGHTEVLHGVQVLAHLPALKKIVAGQGHVLVSDGWHVWAWGDNRAGQLGQAALYQATPRKLDDAVSINHEEART